MLKEEMKKRRIKRHEHPRLGEFLMSQSKFTRRERVFRVLSRVINLTRWLRSNGINR